MGAESHRLPLLCLLILLSSCAFFLPVPQLAPLLLVPDGGLLSPEAPAQQRHTLYALALVAPQVAAALAAPAWGLLSDRYGRRHLLLLTLGGSAMAAGLGVVALWGESLAGFLAALLLMGVCDCRILVIAAVLASSPPSLKAGHIGFLAVCSTLGFVFGPLAGGLLADASHLGPWATRAPLLLACGLNLGATGLVLAYLHLPTRAAATSPILEDLHRLLRLPMVRWLLLCVGLMQLSFAFFYQGAPIVLTQHGLGAAAIGGLASLVAALVGLSSLLLSLPAIRQRGSEQLLGGAFALLAMAAIPLALMEGPLALYLSSLPFALGTSVVLCVGTARMSDEAGQEQQGLVAAVLNAVEAFGLLLAGASLACAGNDWGRVLALGVLLPALGGLLAVAMSPAIRSLPMPGASRPGQLPLDR